MRLFALLLTVLFGIAPLPAAAHSSLLSLRENVNNYVATLEASGDVPEVYAGYAVTFVLGLFSANRGEVPYDYAYVEFSSKDDDVVVFSGLMPGSTGLMPDTTFNIAMPSAGRYEAEVSFVRKNQPSGVQELGKVRFNFDVLENPADKAARPMWKNLYVAAAGAFLIGILLSILGLYGYRRMNPLGGRKAA